jgi:DNA-binding MarR family transcriptional regulator
MLRSAKHSRPTPNSTVARPKPARDTPTLNPDALACAGDVIDVMPVVMDAFRAAMRDNIGGGLSVPQFRCLNFVGHNPDASVSDVAAFMGVTLPTASATSDRLSRAGWLVATVAAADRRRLELNITAAGHELLTRMRVAARADLAGKLDGLPAHALRRARAGLAVLRESFLESTS